MHSQPAPIRPVRNPLPMVCVGGGGIRGTVLRKGGEKREKNEIKKSSPQLIFWFGSESRLGQFSHKVYAWNFA